MSNVQKQRPLSRRPDKGQTRQWRIGDRDIPWQVASQQSLPPFLSAGELHQNMDTSRSCRQWFQGSGRIAVALIGSGVRGQAV